MKVFVKGAPEVTLGEAAFVAEGGEGKVYAIGDTGYKIFHDPARVVPLGKVQELGEIDDRRIIAPAKLLFKAGKTPTYVGHTFRFVRDTWTLCELFPRAFREREGLDGGKVLSLVQSMQKAVGAVHAAHATVVDLNELNVLVDRQLTPYFIDVDSYATPSFPATAIMDSVRDPLVVGNRFTELSDWFSFAILAFQLFIGIHPFKGRHPKLRTLSERMHEHLSVFDPNVGIPKVCYPLSSIPSAYRAWFEALFVHKQRVQPPSSAILAIAIGPVQASARSVSPSRLVITEIASFYEPIRSVSASMGFRAAVVHHGNHVTLLGSGAHGRRDLEFRDCAAGAVVVGLTKRQARPVLASVADGEAVLREPGGARLPPSLASSEMMASGGAIYLRCRDKIVEVVAGEVDKTVLLGTRVAARVLENASRLFEGVALQSLLGEPHATFFPEPGRCFQAFLPELRGAKVMEAKLTADSTGACSWCSQHGAAERTDSSTVSAATLPRTTFAVKWADSTQA
ncbi:hypothetical protein [Nannocystis pusilla]|uniref:hypothetical protein n=1 Tax=Nannocystis pusilla TaxID=889268 RepID=UPI003B79D367